MQMRMLFVDYSSAFNTIVPSKLITKLRTLGLNTICNWILDVPMGCLQVLRVGSNTSAMLLLNIEPLRGACSVQYSLFTHDHTARQLQHHH
jgi:hypothetical protein